MTRSSILALASMCAVACSSSSSGSSGTQPPNDTGTSADDTGAANGDDTGTTDDTAPPCGRSVGDVLCDLQVQGYVSLATTGLASSQAFATFNVSDVLTQGTQKYAFIFETAFW